MKTLVIATTVAALTALPMLAPAQAEEKHEGMQGSPNAAGYGGNKDDASGSTDKAAGGQKMKGPPNANGYEKK